MVCATKEYRMSVNVTVVPSFSLLRVNPEEVHAKYASGYFIHLRLPLTGCKIVNTNVADVRPVIGGDPYNDIFSIHEKSGIESVFLTTDNSTFNSSMSQLDRGNRLGSSTQSGSTPPPILMCMWCGDAQDPNKMPMPIHCETMYNDDGSPRLIFYGSGCYCDYACALADAIRIGHSPDRFNIEYRTSEYYLRTMYAINHPGTGPLEPAPDFRLLQRYGGPLTQAQFKSTAYKYIPTGTFILFPAKQTYQKW